MSEKPVRLTLTKSAISTPEGKLLVECISQVCADGVISLEEAKTLLQAAESISESGIPAVSALCASLREMLKDGKIANDEHYELLALCKRILPKEQREIVQKAVDVRHREMYPITESQIRYILDLGGVVKPGMSSMEASTEIDRLRSNLKCSVRQRMLLRFWGKEELADLSRNQISGWIDDWNSGNPFRMLAWHLWKEEAGDSGEQSVEMLNSITPGIGYQYLKRVSDNESSGATNSEKKSPRGCLIFFIAVPAAVLILLVR